MCQFFVNIAVFVNQYGLAVALDVSACVVTNDRTTASVGRRILYSRPGYLWRL